MNPDHRIVSHAVRTESPLVLSHGSPGECLTARERRLQSKALEAGRAEGLKSGLDRGLAEGRRAAEAELAAARDALAAGARALVEERKRFLDGSRDAVLSLVLAVARKVIHDEVRLSAEAAARVVEAALASLRDATAVRIRVHPGDKSRIEQARPAAPASGHPLPELVADPAIGPGGCIVETDCGSVDATVESQWEIVQAALTQAMREFHGEEPQG